MQTVVRVDGKVFTADTGLLLCALLFLLFNSFVSIYLSVRLSIITIQFSIFYLLRLHSSYCYWQFYEVLECVQTPSPYGVPPNEYNRTHHGATAPTPMPTVYSSCGILRRALFISFFLYHRRHPKNLDFKHSGLVRAWRTPMPAPSQSRRDFRAT